MTPPPSNTPHASPERTGDLITHDATCSECGYALKGLYIGGKCPECGTTIVGEGTSATTSSREPEILGKPLIDAPYGYLRQLNLAFWLMTIAWAAIPIIIILTWTGVIPPSVTPPAPLLYFATAIAWSMGVLITLRDRPLSIRGRRKGQPINEYPRLRLTVALAQIPIVLSPLFELLANFANNNAFLGSLAGLFGFLASIGYIPTAVYLAQIAEWGSDAALARRIRAYGWFVGLGLFGTTFVYLAFTFRNQLPILPVAAAPFWLIAIAMLLVSTVLLATSTIRLIQMTHWLIINKQKTEERDRRRLEKTQREEQKHKRRTEAAVDAKEPETPRIDEALYKSVIEKHENSQRDQHDETDPARHPRFQNEQRLDKTEEHDPYALEDDDENQPNR